MPHPEHDIVLAPQFQYTFGPHAPAQRVTAGGTMRLVCADCDNRLPDGSIIPTGAASGAGSRCFLANPMVGPIEIEGAEPGDSVSVRIERIGIAAGIGRTALAQGHGLLPAHLVAADGSVPGHLYEWTLDPATRRATLDNPLGPQRIELSMRPFVGCIGVCPEHGQQISTLYAGTHGGNMDLPSVAVGATLHLPVFARGALLMLGDLHALQGHGEAIGGAIEAAGEVEITIDLLDKRTLPAPRIRTATEIGAVASDGDLRAAVQHAISRLVAWLADELRLNRFDAYVLVSQTVRIELGNLVNSPYSVAAFIAIDVLPTESRRILQEMP